MYESRKIISQRNASRTKVAGFAWDTNDGSKKCTELTAAYVSPLKLDHLRKIAKENGIVGVVVTFCGAT